MVQFLTILFFWGGTPTILLREALYASLWPIKTHVRPSVRASVRPAIFDHFWGRVKYGYAAAEGVVLFILLNVLAISQYVFFRKRLTYD